MKYPSRVPSVAVAVAVLSSSLPVAVFGQPAARPGTPAVATSPASTSLAKGLSDSFADVYEKVSPGVVVIEVEQGAARGSQASALQYFFQNQPGWDAVPDDYGQQSNQGSGFIITQDGYILTNNHVLEGGSPDAIEVTLHDGRKFPARMIGMDPSSDLAVLKIEAPDLTAVQLGDSDAVRVGEFAFALGAPFDLRYSFTFGIIGAVGRTGLTGKADYEEYIQTDASINPGNSGGPLVDIDGRVVGVNTLINGINRGLGFAIPINLATRISSQIISEGRFMRPWLGIGIETFESNDYSQSQFPNLTSGVLVRSVLPIGPSARSGLRENDVIVSVDGLSVETAQDLQREILGKEIGQDVALEVWRSGRIEQLTVTTAERNDGLMRAANTGGSQRLTPTPAPTYPSFNESTAGMEVKTLTADEAIALKLQAERGVVVMAVEAGSPAELARVQRGDVITSLGSQEVRTVDDLVAAIEANRGRAATLNINRGDEKTYAILRP
ncbi:MAG: trypsin-like peptidase domain-containing protein [Chthoniobacterales bacterium]